MNWLALRMLTGDRTKYGVIVFGVAFATMLMAHQMAVFWGVMQRTVNRVLDVYPNGVWVMNRKTLYVEEVKPLADTALWRVRGVTGVASAVPFSSSIVRAETASGRYRETLLLGIDDVSLVGAPPRMLLGSVAALRAPDSVVIDKAGYTYLWPDQPLRLGHVLEMNERRAVLVGVCDASPPFQTLPVIYARYGPAAAYSSRQRHALSYVLVKPASGVEPRQVCERIERETGLLALTGRDFCRETILYYFRYTGIPTNFGIVVSLGFVVGVAIAGQNFFLFTVENLRQFGALKAMGVTNADLIRMSLLQAMVVAALGFGIGIGLAALLIEASTAKIPHLAGFYLPWQVVLAAGAAITSIMFAASLISIRKVLILEPAVVFRS